MTELILVGGGGHCRSCIDVVEQENRFSIAGIIDIPEKKHQKVLGYTIIASDDGLSELILRYSQFLICVGQIKTNSVRKKLFQKILTVGGQFPTIASPFAYVSRYADVGQGTIIMHHALLNAGVIVGQNCIINSKALLEHDVRVGDNSHISTGAVLNGGVTVGPDSFIGSGSIIRENVSLGAHTFVGCGMTVLRDLPDNNCIGQNTL